MILHRAFAALFGLLLIVAGLVAASYIEFDFRSGHVLTAVFAVAIPGALMLSAFYMAFRLVRFAATGKKHN